jgi:hypothetical protein
MDEEPSEPTIDQVWESYKGLVFCIFESYDRMKVVEGIYKSKTDFVMDIFPDVLRW